MRPSLFRAIRARSTGSTATGRPCTASWVASNALYQADVDAERHRSGALSGPIAAETNEPLAIESRHIALAKMSSQHVECRGLGAERGLAYIAHVVDMKVDEFAEALEARYAGLCRRLTTIDLALGVGCPASCVVSAKEGLADVATFATDLDTP